MSGMLWYDKARNQISALARSNNTTYKRAAGVMAALSPRCRWSQNLKLADDCLQRKWPRTLPLSRRRAMKIARGAEPLEILGGPKTIAFYKAFMGDTEAIVLDSWMLRAANHTISPTPLQYIRLAKKLRRTATKLGLPPLHFQSIIWCKERKSTR